MFKKKAIRVNAYLGYGTSTLFRAAGRALEDEQIDFNTNQNIFKTLLNIFRQFESDEIKNTAIRIELPTGQKIETRTDQEGYYHVKTKVNDLSSYINKYGWVSYSVSFINEKEQKISHNNAFDSCMLIPTANAEYGIISDIDDTILHTGVASLFKWKVIANTFFKNFDKRTAIAGTTNLYNKLHKGVTKNASNPFFYVSNSPWNLYDYLTAFFKTNNYPRGPILLRDFRTPFDKTPKRKIPHKQFEIINLLKMYPELKFILIGDSGEKDADIYTRIATKYPDRILAIYLRNVNHRRKEKKIKEIIKSYNTSPILLTHNSEEIINHAKEAGLIG